MIKLWLLMLSGGNWRLISLLFLGCCVGKAILFFGLEFVVYDPT
jgi:hypothetical protein